MFEMILAKRSNMINKDNSEKDTTEKTESKRKHQEQKGNSEQETF